VTAVTTSEHGPHDNFKEPHVSSDKHEEPGSGRTRNPLVAQLEPVIEQAVREIGLDLDSLDVAQAGRRKVVKVVVDGDEGVGLDEVARASRLVSAALDDNDHVLGGAYTLEVTSPGVDRPLTRPRHWRRARYRLVKVRPKDGPEFTGRVGAAGTDTVRLLVGDELRDISYAEVAVAAVEIEFKQPPAAELALLGAEAEHREQAESGTQVENGEESR
jgi:ribosome maturation factor RimP